MRQGLRTLADLVDRIEGDGVVVDDVSLTRDDGEELAADVSLRFPADGSVEIPVEETDGGLRQPLYRGGTVARSQPAAGPEPVPAVSPDFGGLAVRVGGAAVREMDAETLVTRTREEPADDAESSSDDESYTCRVDGCEETFETEHGMKIHATKAHQAADGSAPSPHRDPERLREVYEACDTFDEMTEALDVDVTAQTVRRSMMSLGIHDPEDELRPTPSAAGGHDAPVADPEEAVQSVAGTGEVDGSDESVVEDETEQTVGQDDAENPVIAGDSDDSLVEDDQDEPTVVDGADEAAAGPAAESGTPGEPAADDADSNSTDDGDEEDATAEGHPDAVPPAVETALPPSVDGEAFVAAVREAKTLYQVQRSLDMERGEVQNLLAEFDLLDLVHGRVATTDEREERKAEIERRILEGGPDGVHVDAE